MEGLAFTKAVASGNDFIIIDNRDSKLSRLGYALPEIAKRLCRRNLAIGADGLLLIERSKKGDFRMRIFNPDGSEAEMCGNGSRCAALYTVEERIAPKEMAIETKAGIVEAEVTGLRVKVRLTDPKGARFNISLRIKNRDYKTHFINTGVPHAVVFYSGIDKIDVLALGKRIRHHKRFGPKGTNVDFVKIRGPKEIKIRTYERGVEAETYACGTGAAASAVVSGAVYGLKPHIDVLTRSGEVLRVYFDMKNKSAKNVYLEGEANVVYRGEIRHV